MESYHNLLKKVLEKGVRQADRTGVGTISIFGEQLRFDLQDGFPLVTTRFISWRIVATELTWFIRGDTNTKYLNDRGVHIWNAWADAKGNLGPIYGRQWRNFGGVDQLANVYNNLKQNPFSRRHIISAWNVPELPQMALEPCHCFMQFNVSGVTLDLQIYIRSNDLFIGAPHNIAEYALLCHLMAKWTGLVPGTLVYTIGNAHIYNNHLEQVETLLARTPYPLPKLQLDDTQTPLTFEPVSARVVNYQHHPAIAASVAV